MAFPLPLIPLLIKGGAAVAGLVGVGAAAKGAKDMKDANDTMKSAQSRHEANVARFESKNKSTTLQMNALGKKELEILQSFDKFSQTIEKIHNRPEFKQYAKNGVNIPAYNASELTKVSVGAGVLLGGLGGAAMGAAGGFAASGATTSAVIALGTASTGTTIASLSGVAAVNSTLAFLGGGTLAAGGGGMAAGTAALGAATLGVGLLVGGLVFSFTGSKLSDKADEAWSEMRRAETQINSICAYLEKLSTTAGKFDATLSKVKDLYETHLTALHYLVTFEGKTDWNTFTEKEQTLTQNTVLLVGLLYNMCKVELVKKSGKEDEVNTVNEADVYKSIKDADSALQDKGLGTAV